MPESTRRNHREDPRRSGVAKLERRRASNTELGFSSDRPPSHFGSAARHLTPAASASVSTARHLTASTGTGSSQNEALAKDGSVGERDDANAVRVKGINFLTFLDAITQCYGQAARERLEREAQGELGEALRFGGIVAGGWYKISWYKAFGKLVGKQFGLDDAGMRRLAQKATASGVNVVYRTLFRITSPAMLLSAGARIFGHYFDRGKLHVIESSTGQIVVEWTECAGFDRYVWNQVIGGVLYYLEAAGGRAVEMTSLGGGGDADWLRMKATFIER